MNGMWNGNRGPQRRQPPASRTNAVNRQRLNAFVSNAHRNYERYLVLAREATSKGDPIEAENCYQHAEHYFRVTRERTN